jgi:hypothetical protein
MAALLRGEGLWKCIQVLGQDFMTTLGTLTLKKKDEIDTNLDKALGTMQCFLDPTCKEIARGSLTAKDIWKIFLRAAGTNLGILTLGGIEHASITFLQRRRTRNLSPKNGKQTMRVCDLHHE